MNKNKLCDLLMYLHSAAFECSEKITEFPQSFENISACHESAWPLPVAHVLNASPHCLPDMHTSVCLYISFSNYSQTNLNCFESAFFYYYFPKWQVY